MSTLCPAAALGHAAFVGADPQPGTRLEASPRDITLSFTEPLNAPLSRARLLAKDGRAIGGVDVDRMGKRLVLRIEAPLPRGAYSVRWHTVSTEDGHALEGQFSFGVRAPAAGGEHAVVQSPLARNGWLRIALRVALYLVLLPLAAAVLLPVLLRRGGPSWLAPASLDAAWTTEASRARRRGQRLIGDLAWLGAIAAVGVTVAEAADAAGGVSAAGLRDFLLSGGSGLARQTLIASVVIVALVVRHHRLLSAAAMAVGLLGLAASGHAASASPRVPSILNDWLHLLSGAVWLGGLALVVLVWAPILRRGARGLRGAVASEVLPVFGRVAAPAFTIAVLSGGVSLLTQLGHIEALWTSAYGRVLLVKIFAVGCVAAISFVHAFRLRPRLLAGEGGRVERRHWRLLRSEPFVAIVVIAAVGILVTFPLPPRQLADADNALAATPACEPCPLPAPAADELAVADRAGSRLVAGWLRRTSGRLSGTLRIIDYRGRPVRTPVAIDGARVRACGIGCSRFDASAREPVLQVSVNERGKRYTARLPARWEPAGTTEARRLLRRAERAMRRLRGVREVEEVTSGPGSYARTAYRLRAPDRMALRTNGGVESVVIADRRWLRAPGQPWARTPYGSGIAFATSSWFRWTPYARAARLLSRRREGGRSVVELALADEATPVWFRLVIEVRTGRVLREQMTARGHYMHSRYLDFDQPLEVRPPLGR